MCKPWKKGGAPLRYALKFNQYRKLVKANDDIRESLA